MVYDLSTFRQQHVLVVGDMMIDKYIIGKVNRISPEAPVPVLHETEVRHKLGGAGNVIINIVSLGARARAMGCVGNDEAGEYFKKSLAEHQVDDTYVFTEGSTIVKTRVTASNQQFIRIDEEEITPPSERIKSKIRDEMDSIMRDITVVVISDYAKGFVTDEIAETIIGEARKRGIPVLIDPKGKRAGKYRGATAITPNTKEFLDLTGLTTLPGEDEIEEEALKLCRENDIEAIIYTRSEKGISTIERKTELKRDYPAVEKEVIDVTGAGDTVVSTIALAMGAGFDLQDCIKIANIAASNVISRFGAAQTTIEEITDAFNTSVKTDENEDDLIERIKNKQRKGKRIVFTNGCFDIVHAGHISSFRQARQYGDILVVGVNSDASVKRIKGDKRPIVDLKNRMALLSSLEVVDYVIPFEEDTPQRLIEKIGPDVLVKGKDWEGKRIAGDEFVKSHGGKVVFIELEQGLSTTSIINKIMQYALN